jgi:hypothetical protein
MGPKIKNDYVREGQPQIAARFIPHSQTSAVVSSRSGGPRKGDTWEDRDIPWGSYFKNI